MPEVIDAPVTAPAAPAAAPETQPVAPATPAAPAKSWTDIFDAADKEDVPPAKTETPPAEPETKPEPEKPVEKVEADKTKTESKPAVEKPTDDLPTFRTNQELRKWAKDRHAAATAAEAKRIELENKLKQLETVVPKSQQDGEALAQQLAAAQKRLAEHEQLIEIQAFEHSEKYQNEYAKPYYQAMDKAEKRISEMMVSEPTGEMDENDQPVMKKRPATKADFLKIYNLPYAQAEELAATLFGRSAERVLAMRENISELAEKAQTALVERRQNYQTLKQQEMAQRSQQEIAIQGLWKKANEAISQDPKRAIYWGEDKEDPESNKALAKGFQLADEFFSEKRDQMSPEQRVEFDAYIRHTIAMGPRLAYKNGKLAAENKALKDENAQLRGSAPGAPKPVGDEPKPQPKDTLGMIDSM